MQFCFRQRQAKVSTVYQFLTDAHVASVTRIKFNDVTLHKGPVSKKVLRRAMRHPNETPLLFWGLGSGYYEPTRKQHHIILSAAQ